MRLAGRDLAPADAAEAIFHCVATIQESIDNGVIPDLDVANNPMLDRLSDIRLVAARIVCLRVGAVSCSFEAAPLDQEDAATAMLGHRRTEVDFDAMHGADPVSELGGLVLWTGAGRIDLEARVGVVVARVGLRGSHKSKLSEIVSGMSQPHGGCLHAELARRPVHGRSVWRGRMFWLTLNRLSGS